MTFLHTSCRSSWTHVALPQNICGGTASKNDSYMCGSAAFTYSCLYARMYAAYIVHVSVAPQGGVSTCWYSLCVNHRCCHTYIYSNTAHVHRILRQSRATRLWWLRADATDALCGRTANMIWVMAELGMHVHSCLVLLPWRLEMSAAEPQHKHCGGAAYIFVLQWPHSHSYVAACQPGDPITYTVVCVTSMR